MQRLTAQSGCAVRAADLPGYLHSLLCVLCVHQGVHAVCANYTPRIHEISEIIKTKGNDITNWQHQQLKPTLKHKQLVMSVDGAD